MKENAKKETKNKMAATVKLKTRTGIDKQFLKVLPSSVSAIEVQKWAFNILRINLH